MHFCLFGLMLINLCERREAGKRSYWLHSYFIFYLMRHLQRERLECTGSWAKNLFPAGSVLISLLRWLAGKTGNVRQCFSAAHMSCLVAHWQASVCVKTQRVDKLQSGFVSAELRERRGLKFSVNAKSDSNVGSLSWFVNPRLII